MVRRPYLLVDGGCRTNRQILVAAITLAAALSGTAAGIQGTAIDVRIERLVASPTPVGPFLLASDAVAWDLTISDSTIVWIEVLARQSSPFILTTTCGTDIVSAPSTHEGRICTRPGTSHVQVDPAAGVAVDILVRFRGHVSDIGGAPSGFTLTQTSDDPGGCIVPGVCLP